MKGYQVEYLAIIETKEEFCSTVESFNSLLQAYGSIKPVENKITYAGSVFDYSVQRGVVADEQQVYFHLKFVCSNQRCLSNYRKFLKLVRTVLQKVSVKVPEVLWDDLSGELCSKAYPVIYELENQMRKLITKFMVISIGVSWVNTSVPKEVSDSVKIKGVSQSYLYDTDFIQLSNFLFKKYSTANSEKLLVKLSKAETIQDLDFSELKEMIPRSNWERYFLPIVDCNSDYLDVRWKKLYDLRCVVAHNNFLSSDQYDEVIKLSGEIKEKLSKAIDSIDQIHISEEQKEEVVESVSGKTGDGYANFVYAWNGLAQVALRLCVQYGFLPAQEEILPNVYLKQCMELLFQKGVVSVGAYQSFKVIAAHRNTNFHNFDRHELDSNAEMHAQIARQLREHLEMLLV
ncbi:HEPN domain-containing protein [Pseudomonas coronafaciens]|uniref:HEPN domain-containing protein n=1 Tax=Pseudomonas coronafaciens TaxID=53409 RepID=UPI000EFFDB6C|nr:HEPN domain-containing protein [Pseudomonas coronafaciens]